MNVVRTRVRTFVLSHIPIPHAFPWNDGCISVQCGSINGHIDGFDMYDDEFGDVADMNWTLCEASAISRIAFDEHALDGCEYVAFAHYRRYVDFSDSDLGDNRLIFSSDSDGRTVISQYASCHPLDMLKSFVSHFSTVECDTCSSICDYLNKSTLLIPTNCFVTSVDDMRRYFGFVRRILPSIVAPIREKRFDYSEYSPYQMRFGGFLFERLTSYWIVNEIKHGVEPLVKRRVELDIKNNVNSVR